jgi:hypothetical protein
LIVEFGLGVRWGEQDGVGDAEFGGEALPGRGLIAVTQEHEAGVGRERGVGLGERLEEDVAALERDVSANVQDDMLKPNPEPFTEATLVVF